jgi:hypothetical protein
VVSGFVCVGNFPYIKCAIWEHAGLLLDHNSRHTFPFGRIKSPMTSFLGAVRLTPVDLVLAISDNSLVFKQGIRNMFPFRATRTSHKYYRTKRLKTTSI